MNKPQKYALVGAGGIGCAIAPILARMGDLVIIDRDSYEPKNSTRQFPALEHTDNKAKILSQLVQKQTLNRVEYIDDFLSSIMITARPEWAGVDCIIGAVDNNRSRRIMAEMSDNMGIPCIMAGNSDSHGEAHLVAPELYFPFNHFEFPDGDPPPWSCNSDEQLESSPQTFIANVLASGAALHILHSWISASNPRNCVAYSRLDCFSADVKRVKDLVPD